MPPGNGSIDAGELRGLLQSLGQYPTPLELIDMMERMDTDGSGAIDFLEFATCLAENDEVGHPARQWCDHGARRSQRCA